ncbi:MAG TPA: superinfection immunity protein [Candidatus Solibacter sp.]|nr:superinfection immunity protein [Candidatus Solibacter sp.]
MWQLLLDLQFQSNSPDAGEAFVELILFLLGLFVYFIPTLVARRKRNSAAIFVLNLFLGWTLVGWVVALVWALTKDSQPGQDLRLAG